jgi:hypothetical protein
MKPTEHVISLETPAPPDFQPAISDLRERLARLEERTENPRSDPALQESLSLASEAHRTAAALSDRIANLEQSASAAAQQTAQEVAEVIPPEPIATPPAEAIEEPAAPESHEPHHPWWNPMRYL